MTDRYAFQIINVDTAEKLTTLAVIIDTERGEPVAVTEVGREETLALAEDLCLQWNTAWDHVKMAGAPRMVSADTVIERLRHAQGESTLGKQADAVFALLADLLTRKL